MARGKSQNADAKTRNGNGANLGFDAQMFLAADTLRKHLEPSDSKHVTLGLIFLTHLSTPCEARQPTIDTPVHVRREPRVHLRAHVSERCPPGWVA